MGRVAHAMAQESPYVKADVVEVQEYPHLAQAYGVQGVPKTVINNRVTFTGAVPESEFLQRVLEAVEDGSDGEVKDIEAGESTPLA